MEFKKIFDFFSFFNNKKNENFIKKIFNENDVLLVTGHHFHKEKYDFTKEKEKSIITIQQLLNNQTNIDLTLPILIDNHAFLYLLNLLKEDQDKNNQRIKEIKNKIIFNISNINFLSNNL